MVHERDEQVEKELASSFHLVLHGAAALERLPAADDEGEVVRAQVAVRVGRVGVGEARRRQNRAALDSGLETLFLEGQALELLQAVALGGTLQFPSANE